MLGRLQFWLQGHGPQGYGCDNRICTALGNAISDMRWYWWRLRGGKYYGEE